MESEKFDSLKTTLKSLATDRGIDLTNDASRFTLWGRTSSQGYDYLGKARMSEIDLLVGKSPMLQDTVIYDAELNRVILRNCEVG